METKSLQPESVYNKYDLDKDGTVSDEELQRNQKLMELEEKHEKVEAQKKMAWVAMMSMIVFSTDDRDWETVPSLSKSYLL